MDARGAEGARLAELIGGLALATDLAAGLEGGTSGRVAVMAVGLGRVVGVGAEGLEGAFYGGLLRFVGCSGFAHEAARVGGGDDIGWLGGLVGMDGGRLGSVARTVVRHAGKGTGAVGRLSSVVRTLADPGLGMRLATAHCAQAVALAAHLGAPAGAVEALGQVYERFDGRGGPAGLRGEAIGLAARLVHVALRAEIHRRLEGRAAAVAVLRERRGGELDPALVDAAVRESDRLFAMVEGKAGWEALFEAEPEPWRRLAAGQLSAVAEAFGRFADLKSPWTLGHSAGVAARAQAAAGRLGLDAAECAAVRIAGHLHDLGQAAIPEGIWERRGGLDEEARERVQLHTYHSERILGRSPLLAPYAKLVGAHHERLDGSGYHRNAAAGGLPPAARLLAVADVAQALGEDRPHRAAFPPERASAILEDEVRAGRLDGDAVAAVRAAAQAGRPASAATAGHAARAANPAGLSDREVEILVLVARGLTNKEIGARLHISPRTAGNHVAHIYEKAGVSNRAAAALFAVTRGLVEK